MRRALASLIVFFAVQVHAHTVTEGRVQGNAPTQLGEERVSRYTDAPALSSSSVTVGSSGGAEKNYVAIAPKPEAQRPASVALAQSSSWFRIYDAGVSLRRDRDGDGHHSEFQVRFDADSYVGDELVYAKLYLRRVGSTGSWTHYHTTDDFWIYGQSGADDYFVTTTLNEGFPTGDYDVLIDLYESGHSGIVATLTAFDDGSLAALPLEETGLDVAFGLPGYSIRDVSTTLLIDDDHDGFYSKFRITFDPDTDFGSSTVYAIAWLRAAGGEWIKEHESDDFVVNGDGNADAYSFTADWISGYPTAEYDLQLDLYDAATGKLVASAGSERRAFSRIPLEDQSRDRVASAPTNGGSIPVTTSRERGGGSLSLWLATALMGLLVMRSIMFRNRLRRETLRTAATRRAEKYVGR